jgi:hypothetical protein
MFVTTEIDAREGDAAAARAIDCHKSQMTARDMEQRKSYQRDVLGGLVYLRLVMTDGAWPQGKETALFGP